VSTPRTTKNSTASASRSRARPSRRQARPGVAVVVVNYNGSAFIEEFAASLAGVPYKNRRLYLVDNASQDGSRERVASFFPTAELILNHRNLGLAPAINQALGASLTKPTDYVLLLNGDTTQEPDFLDRLVDAADARTIVVPKVLHYHDHGRINTHAGGFDWRRGLFHDTHDGEIDGPATSETREIETASFCCMLIPRAVFTAIGPVDERLAMYYEDTDFVARARRAGFRLLFEPSAVVYHREGGSSGGKESPFKHYYATRNRPFLVRKHVSASEYVLFTAYFLSTRFGKVVEYAGRRDWPLLRAQLLALRDFYTGRMGMTYEPRDFGVQPLVGPPL